MAKQKFKITHWPAYNRALRQRGSLTIWLDESAIAAWTDNSSPERRGRPLHYTDEARQYMGPLQDAVELGMATVSTLL